MCPNVTAYKKLYKKLYKCSEGQVTGCETTVINYCLTKYVRLFVNKTDIKLYNKCKTETDRIETP